MAYIKYFSSLPSPPMSISSIVFMNEKFSLAKGNENLCHFEQILVLAGWGNLSVSPVLLVPPALLC